MDKLEEVKFLFERRASEPLQFWDKNAIAANKLNYPGYEEKLGEHLARMQLTQLAQCLVWIEYTSLSNVEALDRGGFATVYKATVQSPPGRGFATVDHYGNFVRPGAVQEEKEIAFKEMDMSLLHEVCVELSPIYNPL